MAIKTCRNHYTSIVVYDGDDCPLCRAEEIFSSEETTSHSGAGCILAVLAYIDLFVSILAAIIILAKFGTSDYTGLSRINPIGVGIGLAVLLQGIFGWAFFLVIASIAKELNMIKRYLELNRHGRLR
jgi:hypothetical protein